MTYSTALRTLIDLLSHSSVDAPRVKAEWILQEGCGIDRARVVAYPDAPVDESCWNHCLVMARRSAEGEPLQYVFGHTEFFGLRLGVTRDVLIPRPETEQLVELLLTEVRSPSSPRILDIGTGSGCIALALASQRPDARVWACDKSAAALGVAYSNSRDLGLSVGFFEADAMRAGFARAFSGILDVVVSNPPYVSSAEVMELPEDVRSYEPHLALFSPGDPLAFYPAIAAEAAAVLRPGGHIYFEVHEERPRGVAEVLRFTGFTDIRIERDLAGRFRFVTGRLA